MRISAVVELISRPRALALAEPAGPPALDESLDLLPGLGVGHLRRRALEAAVDRLADQVRLRDPVLLRPHRDRSVRQWRGMPNRARDWLAQAERDLEQAEEDAIRHARAIVEFVRS